MPVPTSKLVYRNFKRRLKGCCVCNKTVTQHNMLKPTDKSGRGLQSGARRGPGPYSKLMPQSESAVKGYLPRCPSVSRCFLWLYLTPPARKRRNEGAPRAPNEQPASRFSRAKCCNESILPAANSKQLWRTQTSTLTCSRNYITASVRPASSYLETQLLLWVKEQQLAALILPESLALLAGNVGLPWMRHLSSTFQLKHVVSFPGTSSSIYDLQREVINTTFLCPVSPETNWQHCKFRNSKGVTNNNRPLNVAFRLPPTIPTTSQHRPQGVALANGENAR